MAALCLSFFSHYVEERESEGPKHRSDWKESVSLFKKIEAEQKVNQQSLLRCPRCADTRLINVNVDLFKLYNLNVSPESTLT